MKKLFLILTLLLPFAGAPVALHANNPITAKASEQLHVLKEQFTFNLVDALTAVIQGAWHHKQFMVGIGVGLVLAQYYKYWKNFDQKQEKSCGIIKNALLERKAFAKNAGLNNDQLIIYECDDTKLQTIANKIKNWWITGLFAIQDSNIPNGVAKIIETMGKLSPTGIKKDLNAQVTINNQQDNNAANDKGTVLAEIDKLTKEDGPLRKYNWVEGIGLLGSKIASQAQSTVSKIINALKSNSTK